MDDRMWGRNCAPLYFHVTTILYLFLTQLKFTMYRLSQFESKILLGRSHTLWRAVTLCNCCFCTVRRTFFKQRIQNQQKGLFDHVFLFCGWSTHETELKAAASTIMFVHLIYLGLSLHLSNTFKVCFFTHKRHWATMGTICGWTCGASGHRTTDSVISGWPASC